MFCVKFLHHCTSSREAISTYELFLFFLDKVVIEVNYIGISEMQFQDNEKKFKTSWSTSTGLIRDLIKFENI